MNHLQNEINPHEPLEITGKHRPFAGDYGAGAKRQTDPETVRWQTEKTP
jgi:hypothetical protein